MKGVSSALGRVIVSEDALVWAKIRKVLDKKGAEAAIFELQRIRSEQSLNRIAALYTANQLFSYTQGDRHV